MSGLDTMFWAEVKADGATSRSIAVCYALLIAEEASLKARFGADHKPRDWFEINDSVMLYHRGIHGLERVLQCTPEICPGHSPIGASPEGLGVPQDEPPPITPVETKR